MKTSTTVRKTFLDKERTGLIALVSLSGTTWSYSQTHWSEVARGETNNASRAVAFGNALFIAAFDNRIFSSTDGKIWTVRGPTPWHGDQLGSFKFMNNRFVACDGNLWTSTDGSGWKQTAISSNFTARSVAHGQGLFVAVGETPAGAACASSTAEMGSHLTIQQLRH
jgi:hypothetical protein